MTVKFRDSVSAQACVIVSTLGDIISDTPSNDALLVRKWMADFLQAGE